MNKKYCGKTLLSVVWWHLHIYRHGCEKRILLKRRHILQETYQLHFGQKLIQHWYQRTGQVEEEVCIKG